ncbi:MAG: S8 family serine peptidase, partial [Gammaproteobacteria bacterium]|nr:S8 family serine peptidase [Gammaproteobacteria bacterium]
MRHSGLPDDACDLVFFSREDRARVAEQLTNENVEILDSSDYKLRLRYRKSLRHLREIHGVKLVDHSRPTQLCTNEDLNTAIARPVATIGGSDLRGRGQVIAVADTGLDSGVNDDSLHPDFKGRVKAIVSLPLNKSWNTIAQHADNNDGGSDRHSGHGTHVAGLALGNGIRSGGLHQGVAPAAELVFQAIEQYVNVKDEYSNEFKDGYYLCGRPLDLNELFEQAREFGARIHVNAWGDEARGNYTDDCYEADHFLAKHPDALILFAAGNSGADKDGNRILDKQSLFSPASAKNVVAVGATEGGIEDIGLRASWGAFDPNNSRFRSGADRADPISGDAQRIALFSSAGPSRDGRIKPDVCAPGTNLVAPRSRLSAGKGWGLASPLPYYMYNGGTSMSVGVVGGAAAVLREAWEHRNGQAPSGQALKSLLVISTAPVLSRRNDLAEPEYVGGFGRIQIALALPENEKQKITLIDERDHSLSTGEIREFPITLNQQGSLRAVLSWYDPPGETLINNLDLCLIEPSGERVWGNHRPGERGEPDEKNTIETITINNLAAGRYTLRVIAANVPMGPQSFALAISQPLSHGLDLPLVYLRGIGTRINQRFNVAGIKTIAEVPVGEELAEIVNISNDVQKQLRARLNVLAQVRQVLNQSAFNLEGVSINKL